MKRWIALALFIVPLIASAEGFWDGNAAIQSGDPGLDAGMSALSNSFSPGTEIQVENLDNGKKATVTVSDRMGEQTDTLVFLSPLAAKTLGFAEDEIARVRITIPPQGRREPPVEYTEITESRDPDVNPAAGAPEAEPQTETLAATAPAEPTEIAQAAEERPSSEETPQEEAEGAEPAGGEEQTGGEMVSEPEASLLAGAMERSPQKQLFQPPREDEKFVFKKSSPATQGEETQLAEAAPTAEPEIQAPAEPAEQVEAPSIEETAEAPAVEAATTEPAVEEAEAPAEVALEATEAQPETAESQLETAEAPLVVEVQPPRPGAETSLVEPEPLPALQQAETAETISIEGSKPRSMEAEIALSAPEPLPAENKPAAPSPRRTDVSDSAAAPEAASAQEYLALAFPEAPAPRLSAPAEKPPQPAAEKTPQPKAQIRPAPEENVKTVLTPPRLGKGETWYLQLGAFATERVANDLATRFAETYPILVLSPAANGKRVYRVLVGPLNKAESGTLLAWFRYRGFPDAFLKKQL
jgi:hypothetical protein